MLVLRPVFQCQDGPCFCLGSYRRPRNLTEYMCAQISHVWTSETVPLFSSRLTLYRGPAPWGNSPVAWTSIALSLSLIAQPFPAQGRSPEAVALVPIDGFQAVGFPVLVVFLPKNPKSSDLVGGGERIDYLRLASFPFEDARVTRM